MKIRAKEEIAILVDETYNLMGYIHKGQVLSVSPTDDGMKFEVFGLKLSPYDFAGKFELVDTISDIPPMTTYKETLWGIEQAKIAVREMFSESTAENIIESLDRCLNEYKIEVHCKIKEHYKTKTQVKTEVNNK